MKLKSHRFLPWRAGAATLALAAALTLDPALAATPDLDRDGIANRLDSDVDGDGIPNVADRNVDGGKCRKGPLKGKYVGDRLSNGSSGEKDIDDDGLADDSRRENDIDGDRRNDDARNEKDIDGDGRRDREDDDIDGDDIDNADDDDCDGDGKGRGRDDDDDGDELDDDDDDDDNGDGFDDDDLAETEVPLKATASAPAGSRVRVKVKQLPNGNIELEFDGRNLAEGDYDVVVNGQVLGQLSMEDDDGRTEGEVEFKSNADDDDENPLPFNPIGLPIEIVQGAVTFFTGTVPTPPAP